MEMRVKVGDFVSPWFSESDFEDVEFEARKAYPVVHVRFLNRPEWRGAWEHKSYTYNTDELLEVGDLVIAGMHQQLAVVVSAFPSALKPGRPTAKKVTINGFGSLPVLEYPADIFDREV